jgi:HlyD family secretion protein
MAWLRRIFSLAFVAAVLAAIVYSFRPQPLEVDWAVVSPGPLEVTVNEDGRTRIREKYTVSTPLAGQLQRVVLNPGDPVIAGKTLLATILPTNPDLLDPRSRSSAEARVKAAEAGVKRSQANTGAAQAAMESAQSMLDRRTKLRKGDATFEQAVEDAQMQARMRSEELRSAEFAHEIAKFELELAQAALVRTSPQDDPKEANWHLDVISPIQGKILRVFQESSAVLPAGTALMEIGDPRDLELEVDVLSTDAVKILPGAKMRIQHWGGDQELEARVRLVEPGAFTKVSALGVEEQRVNVIGDLVSPAPEQFGDRFRFEARIVTWNSESVLKVPMSALFRKDTDWAVFVVDSTLHAQRKVIQIGHRNSDAAEVLGGLAENDRVIIFPSDQVTDGVMLKLKVQE